MERSPHKHAPTYLANAPTYLVNSLTYPEHAPTYLANTPTSTYPEHVPQWEGGVPRGSAIGSVLPIGPKNAFNHISVFIFSTSRYRIGICAGQFESSGCETV